MKNITPEDFLQSVFSLSELDGNQVMLTYRPPDGGGWYNRVFSGNGRRRIAIGTKTSYFCVSTVAQGSTKRRAQDVREAWVVVCDDVTTKCYTPPVRPSYIIETSEKNYQYGYLIEPFDVSTPEGRIEYDSVLFSLVKAGYNDPGCRSATRVVRLPGSLHSTGFVARVIEWSPERIWDLGALLPEMQVDQVYPTSGGGAGCAANAGRYERLDDVIDPVYAWLCDHNRVLGHNDAWVHIECPWRDTHTGGAQGVGDTSFSPEEYNTAAPAFKCQHGHCTDKKLPHFRAWLEKQGCPVSWGDPDIGDAARLALIDFMESRT